MRIRGICTCRGGRRRCALPSIRQSDQGSAAEARLDFVSRTCRRQPANPVVDGLRLVRLRQRSFLAQIGRRNDGARYAAGRFDHPIAAVARMRGDDRAQPHVVFGHEHRFWMFWWSMIFFEEPVHFSGSCTSRWRCPRLICRGSFTSIISRPARSPRRGHTVWQEKRRQDHKQGVPADGWRR